VYFSSAPVLNASAAGGFGGGGGRGGGEQIPGVGMNLTPNAVPERLATIDGTPSRRPEAAQAEGPGGGFGGGQFGGGPALPRPRVIMQFPNDPNDMLLSGGLVGGQVLSGRAIVVDAPVGKGHVVMFANRPYWRWETHGNFFLGFNAILNWNHLDAGKAAPAAGSQQ
jgi:hypothetical protein